MGSDASLKDVAEKLGARMPPSNRFGSTAVSF
jgi:hypothetical protein